MHGILAFAGYKTFSQEPIHTMSIEKKSLISTLKTTKKANVASAPATKDGSTSRKVKLVKSARRASMAHPGKM
jgi:hypothetical protein